MLLDFQPLETIIMIRRISIMLLINIRHGQTQLQT